MQSAEYPDLPFVAPASWTSSRPGGQPTLLVVHYTAGSEGPTAAEDGAAYDARRTDGTSCHFFIDRDSTVQCVYTFNTAHSAYPEGNKRGIQYELCGTVQNRAQWLDAASLPTIERCARQMVRDAKKYGIPLVKITPAQMRAGAKGICGHGDVTAAWGEGDHTDPGAEFPWDILLEKINGVLKGAGGKATMFFAKGGDGQLYCVSGRLSQKINKSDIGGIVYVAGQTGETIFTVTGPESEKVWYTASQYVTVRAGWSPEVFGAVYPPEAPKIDLTGASVNVNTDQMTEATLQALEGARGQNALKAAANAAEDS